MKKHRQILLGDFSQDEIEYNFFVEKFKPKKTTDDCYTPSAVYEAVKGWVLKKYPKMQNKEIIRPFYPGGDYKNQNYAGKFVLDNPPFSILSEIEKFYLENEIDFFLFAPGLTIFKPYDGLNYILTNSDIRYENGALVNTAFVTNLGGAKIEVSHELHELVKNSQGEKVKIAKKTKLKFPKNVVTAARLSGLARYSDLKINNCYYLGKLKQRTPYGGCFLLSDKEAEKVKELEKVKEAEKTEFVCLSRAEMHIIDYLNKRETKK